MYILFKNCIFGIKRITSFIDQCEELLFAEIDLLLDISL